MRAVAIICSAIVGVSFLSLPAVAQQKTVKACQEEWRANKDANQAKGITQKAYVTQCRAAGGAAPAAAPAAPSTAQKKPETTVAPAGNQKTAKACRDEWRANKDANQAKGITEKAYVAQCRTGGTVAAPAAPMAPPAAPAKPAAAPAPPPPASTMAKPAPTAQTAPTGANQYTTEAQAKIRCISGTVVWANLNSKIYHFSSYKDYGGTKSGAYMCETDATAQGMRAAKNEKHP